ncbi:alanine racemase [Lachnospiraceae bacterium 48-42]|nr:alanine racemase [Dorea sp.]
MKEYNRICARVDLDAVEYNIERMKQNISSDASMLAVVKMDGYGHGAVQIAQMLEEKEYIWGCAVATPEEALILKKQGIRKPVLVLGCVFPEQREEMVRHEIRLTVYTKEMAEELSRIAEEYGKDAYIHVKLDTGMSRLGFLANRESVGIIEEISRLPHLVMEGLYTHFSKSDEEDKGFTRRQLEDFLYMKRALEEREVFFSWYHCSNSAAIIDMEEANMNLVRAGIASYGMYPSGEVKKEKVPLKPAMELISHVAHVKWVGPGTPVSYGGTFVTRRDTRIATIPVGYGDGYPRKLSGKGYVLIHGKKAPILGRVCMDQFMVDVTEIPNVSFGDTVTLVGHDGGEFLPVEVLSRLSGRFNYEFVCNLGKRIPRTYLRHGKVVGQMDYFE